MAISEIWIPEILIVVFLSVPYIRPYFKRSYRTETIRTPEGLVWLQIIALGITAAIFPAYGYRPECLPILLFALFVNIINFFFYIRINISGPGNFQNTLIDILALVTLVFCAIPMFVFSPKTNLKPVNESGQVKTLKINVMPGRDFYLRVYGPVQSERPLVLLIPPETGSAVSVDLVCTALQNNNYTVVTYFYSGTDTPLVDENGRKHPVSPVKYFSYRRMRSRAQTVASVNEQGKKLENGRRAEIEFLLTQIPSLSDNKAAPPPILLAGYGAGGSAAAWLAGDKNFAARHSNVLGAIAVESRLWTAYRAVPRAATKEVPAENNDSITGYILRYLNTALEFFKNLKPEAAEFAGPLPDSCLPVLYLVSGRALENNRQLSGIPYKAVFETMRSSAGPVALAAVESAGPLDYQDYPLTHPLYSFLRPGLKGAKKSENPVNNTAGIIGNFAAMLLEKTEGEIIIPPHQATDGSLYIESRGLGAFRL